MFQKKRVRNRGRARKGVARRNGERKGVGRCRIGFRVEKKQKLGGILSLSLSCGEEG